MTPQPKNPLFIVRMQYPTTCNTPVEAAKTGEVQRLLAEAETALANACRA